MLSLLFSRPARLNLAGQSWRLSELRIADLADLEAWVTGGMETFWVALLDVQAIEDVPARYAALRDLYDRAERCAGSVGSPEWAVALASPAGRIRALWRGLRPYRQPALDNQRPTREQVEVLAERLTPEEWLTTDRILWAADPLDEVAKVIDAEIGAVYQPAVTRLSPDDWLKGFVATANLGWPPEWLARLTLSQWMALCIYSEMETEDRVPDFTGKRHPVALGDMRLSKEDRDKRKAFWKNGSPG